MTCDFCGRTERVARFTSGESTVALDVCAECQEIPSLLDVHNNRVPRGAVAAHPYGESPRPNYEGPVGRIPSVRLTPEASRQSLAQPDHYGYQISFPDGPAIRGPERETAGTAVLRRTTDKRAAFEEESAGETLQSKIDDLDFVLEAAAAIAEKLGDVPKDRIAAVAFCRGKLQSVQSAADYERLREYAARQGLLADGAELGFRSPPPQAETDLERQKRQAEFERVNAPQQQTKFAAADHSGGLAMTTWGDFTEEQKREASKRAGN